LLFKHQLYHKKLNFSFLETEFEFCFFGGFHLIKTFSFTIFSSLSSDNHFLELLKVFSNNKHLKELGDNLESYFKKNIH
jgi:hypothetical protein